MGSVSILAGDLLGGEEMRLLTLLVSIPLGLCLGLAMMAVTLYKHSADFLEDGEMKKTPWLNASEHKPIRIGVYEVMLDGCYKTWYSRWDGKYWRACAISPHEAAKQRDKSEWMHEGAEWRGLTASAWLREKRK